MHGRQAAIGLAVMCCFGCDQVKTNTAPAPLAPAPSAEGGPVDGGESERVKASAGVGKKGRSLDNETGIGAVIAQPAKALFSFEEKAVFDIQIPQAMRLFAAMNGNNPKSHDEFMTRIIRANNIQLPELPEGQKYEFDPERGELMVLRPRP